MHVSDRQIHKIVVGLAAPFLACAILQASAGGQTVTWCIDLDGPTAGTNSAATGTGTVQLDTQLNLLSWNIVHQGLHTHTASHFHGPAQPGQPANVQVTIGVGSPLVGSAPISQQQANDLMAGLWYLNLHTTLHVAGEIRGQVDCLCFSVHCSAAGNSFDPAGARLTTSGDITAANNDISFLATGVPPNQFGFLLVGLGTGVFNPPGSSGAICLAGQPIGRFNGQILVANGSGELGSFTPDILNLPTPPGGQVMAGQSWGFQAWFRDGATNNFTDGITVSFK